MKRLFVSAAAVLLVVLTAAICLTACGNSNTSDSTADSAVSVLTEADGTVGGYLEDGTYKMTQLVVGGKDAEWLKTSLEEAGTNTDLIVEGDKVTLLETEHTLTDGKLVGEPGTSTYAVKDSVVTVIDADGTKMVFEKK